MDSNDTELKNASPEARLLRINRYLVGRGLSPQEVEVGIYLAGWGMNNAEISERMNITPATVKFHVTNLFKKMGSSTRLRFVVTVYSEAE